MENSTVKNYLLKQLSTNYGEYISGPDITEKLGVSRNAVSKAAIALAEDGYAVSARTKMGYRLDRSNMLSSPYCIENHLKTDGIRVRFEKTVDSTNSVLKAAAEDGEEEGLLLVANEQTGGRGRLGRDFFSPPGTGLYMSILLRPTLLFGEAPLITTCAAVAVAEALEEISGKKAAIKWVNDVLIGGRKVCGILTEASLDMERGAVLWAVLGIGINLFPPKEGFGPLSSTAGSVIQVYDCGGELKDRLAASVCDRFFNYYRALPEKRHLDEYRRRSVLTGRDVTVLSKDEKKHAVVLGIDDDFRIMVKYPDGTEEKLSSGEVSVKL